MDSSWALKINTKPCNDKEETWTHWLSDKNPFEKAAYSRSPTLGLSGKGKTMKTVKKKYSVIARGWEVGGMNRFSMGIFLGSKATLHDTAIMNILQIHDGYCKDGYTSLYICPNPQASALRVNSNVNHEVGWWWCAHRGSSLVKKKKKMQHFVWDLNNGGGRGLCMSTDSGGVESSVPPS